MDLGGMEIVDLKVCLLTWTYGNYRLGGMKIMDLGVWKFWTWEV